MSEVKRYVLIESKLGRRCNCVVSRRKDRAEIVVYSEPFTILEGQDKFLDVDTGEVVTELSEGDQLGMLVDGDYIESESAAKYYPNDRSPCFRKNKDGVFERNKPCSMYKLLDILARGDKEAQKRYYNYALTNGWKYFATFTVDPKAYGKEDETRKKLWQHMVKRLQYLDAAVKILATPELHTAEGENKNTLHFHALIGNVDLDERLTVARNRKTLQQLKTKYGHLVYNLHLWNGGHSTVVKIGRTQTDQMTVVNYLCKYLTEGGNVGYRQKRFYHTRNLEYPEVEVIKINEDYLKNDLRVEKKETCWPNPKLTVYYVAEADLDSVLHAERERRDFSAQAVQDAIRKSVMTETTKYADFDDYNPFDELGRLTKKPRGNPQLLGLTNVEVERKLKLRPITDLDDVF